MDFDDDDEAPPRTEPLPESVLDALRNEMRRAGDRIWLHSQVRVMSEKDVAKLREHVEKAIRRGKKRKGNRLTRWIAGRQSSDD